MAAWQAAAVALAIGLLIGSERERSGGSGSAGVRTFALAALAGCLAGLIDPLAFAAALIAAGALVVIGYTRTSAKDPGLTTETALVLTVVLGGLAARDAALAAGAGVAATVVLVSKERLHHFVRDTVTDVEVADALKFFVVAFVVLPLVGHAHLGPYGVIDPRQIWILVVAVTALGWLGYLAVRLLGPGRGLPVAGLAGGFVSGTATTAAMARQARAPGLGRPALAAALLAGVATLVQLVAVTAVADRRVAGMLAPAAVAGSVLLAGEAGFLVWIAVRRGRRGRSGEGAQPPAGRTTGAAPAGPAEGGAGILAGPVGGGGGILAGPVGDGAGVPAGPEGGGRAAGGADATPAGPSTPPAPAPAASPAGRPFALLPALVLAGVLTFFLALASVAEHRFGTGGSLVAIAAAGLADAHAGALTAATLAASGQLAPASAALAAMTAVGVNTLVKVVVAMLLGGRRFGATFAGLLALPVAGVAIALVTTITVLT